MDRGQNARFRPYHRPPRGGSNLRGPPVRCSTFYRPPPPRFQPDSGPCHHQGYQHPPGIRTTWRSLAHHAFPRPPPSTPPYFAPRFRQQGPTPVAPQSRFSAGRSMSNYPQSERRPDVHELSSLSGGHYSNREQVAASFDNSGARKTSEAARTGIDGCVGIQIHSQYTNYKDRTPRTSSTSSEPPVDKDRKQRDSSASRHRLSSTADQKRPTADCRGGSPPKSRTEREREKQEMIEQALEEERRIWTRSSPADLSYQRHENDPRLMCATERTKSLCAEFVAALIEPAVRARAEMAAALPQQPSTVPHFHSCCHGDDSSCSDDESSDDEAEMVKAEIERKAKHPYRVHPELWFNEQGKMNTSDVCRCSLRARETGVRHNVYAGENVVPRCDSWTNNVHTLYHYHVLTCPPTNLLVSRPTTIEYDGHEFLFEGFSLLSHYRLENLPPCHIVRFNIEYTVMCIPESFPESFVIREVELFEQFLMQHLLELYDLDLFPHCDKEKQGCPVYHMMPRFARDLPDNGKELLSMKEVLRYLIDSHQPLIRSDQLSEIAAMEPFQWRDFVDGVRGMLVYDPARVPHCLRLDQLDRDSETAVVNNDNNNNNDDNITSGNSESTGDGSCGGECGGTGAAGVVCYPDIVHFGVRPTLATCAGNQEYQKAWRAYLKQCRLMASLSKPTADDKRCLVAKQEQVMRIRAEGAAKRDVTVVVSSRSFYRTGVWADVVQHALFLPVVICNLRFHKSLEVLEEQIKYKFKQRRLLQLALTHPSYRLNHGTNADHSRNSMTNCGIRRPEYGDRCIHYTVSRKRGLDILINIMSQFGKSEVTESRITHNERLEFFGDAVVEFLTSIHLFFLFPGIEEGGLATYRTAIVQNQQLAVLAQRLGLQHFLLYAHGADLCHDAELRHALANCFESVMAALYLDGGLELADRVFSSTLFSDSDSLLDIWLKYPPHPLQEQEPNGDRKWIDKFPRLKELCAFEERIGVEFKHVRLLARAFTNRSVGYNNLTLGSNQRLEFLGDSVLQLIASEYLYTHFPEHHEGHLSLLRSSLVNNRTQSVVCTDLGMTEFATFGRMKSEVKMKDKADLLEAFIGALYVDKGLDYCRKFCEVCFFPRLHLFIMNQDWNDPKSKLQQCCLTLRKMDGTEPDIPIYKVIECKGPTNSREYTVAVYFQSKRLSKASGYSIQMAEMNAASKALSDCKHLFPQLDRHQRVIAYKASQQHRQLRQYYGDTRSPRSDVNK